MQPLIGIPCVAAIGLIEERGSIKVRKRSQFPLDWSFSVRVVMIFINDFYQVSRAVFVVPRFSISVNGISDNYSIS